jgi:uncharacterized protein (TIGR03086 family)
MAVADRVPLDFDPPVRMLRALLLGVDDDDLAGPTPCPDWDVAALLDHLMGLSHAFTQAARKRTDPSGGGPEPSAQHLPPHWRSRLPVLLEELATAWKDPYAWTGTTQAGGVVMPATAIGMVAMNEVIMHSWDLAMATGQEYAADPRTLEVLIEFLSEGPAEGTPGMFGPRVAVDDEATFLDLALALAGRDTHWRRPRRRPNRAA